MTTHDSVPRVRSIAKAGGRTRTQLPLFRAVRAEELESIQQLGRFTNPAGIEIKYFTLTELHARKYAELARARFGDGPYTIIQSSMPVKLLDLVFRIIVDGGIEAVTIPLDLLYSLSRPLILENP